MAPPYLFEGAQFFDNHGRKAAFRDWTGSCAVPTTVGRRWDTLASENPLETGTEPPHSMFPEVAGGREAMKRIARIALALWLLRATWLRAWNALLCSRLSGPTLRLQTLAPLVVVVSSHARVL